MSEIADEGLNELFQATV